MAPSQFESPPVNRHVTELPTSVRLRTLLGSVCLLVAGGVAPQLRAAEPDHEIVPIQFAELIEQENAAVEVLMIPSVVVDDEVVVEGAVSDGPREQTLEDVSARAADGLRVQEFGVDEMPDEASSGDWFSSGRWYGSAEMLWFDRSRNYRRVLGYDVTFTPGENPVGTLTTTGIPFDLSAGARVTLGEHLDRDHLDRDRALEVTFYGGLSYAQQDSWNALPGSFLVTPLADVPGFDGATAYGTSHTSNFNSLEWNYKLHRRLGRDQLVMSPNGTWTRHAERAWLPALIIGTRLATVNESFRFTSSRNDRPLTEFGGNYEIDTQNWLWGFNLGSELISQNEFYYWGLRGHVTPSMSFAANQQSVVSVNSAQPEPPPNSINRTSAADQLGPGFVGDLSLFAGWNITPNFSLKAGYDFLWVAGIATATRQFDLDNVRQNPMDGGGQIFFNGLSLGCEGSW